MNKIFRYEVEGWEAEDTTAFGKAWQQAKAEAVNRNAAIYRTIFKGEDEKREVFCKGGIFVREDLARPEAIQVF